MKVTLKRQGHEGCKFECVNEQGNTAIIDGPASVGGKDEGVRPMQMVLMGLAGCAAVDLLLILGKQRQNPTDVEIEVEANRADAIPAVFTDIHIHFIVSGEVSEKKLERAASLSVEKYCSVATMLQPDVKITQSASLK